MGEKQNQGTPVGCVVSLFKRIGIFVLVFIIYDLILATIFPVDESNYLICPDWCSTLGVLLSLIASTFDLLVHGIVFLANSVSEFFCWTNRVVAWWFGKTASIRKVHKDRVEPPLETAEQYRHSTDAQTHEMAEQSNGIGMATGGNLESQMKEIDSMEGHAFEEWCAEALRNSGFSNVSVTPGSGDQGVDVLAEKDGIKYAVQCKRYFSDLGNTPVQEVYLGKAFYKCHVGVVLTNQHFTAGAKEAASVSAVLLWDREWIKSYLSKQQNIPTSGYNHSATGYKDELLPVAVDAVFETGQASVSMLQRRLNIGYARAARIVDEMEELGIVGAFRGSSPRAIMVTKSQWEAMQKQK